MRLSYNINEVRVLLWEIFYEDIQNMNRQLHHKVNPRSSSVMIGYNLYSLSNKNNISLQKYIGSKKQELFVETYKNKDRYFLLACHVKLLFYDSLDRYFFATRNFASSTSNLFQAKDYMSLNNLFSIKTCLFPTYLHRN